MSSSYIERRICLGFIACDKVCKDLFAIYRPQFMESKSAIKIIDWCREYFEAYNKAPGKNIQAIYAQKEREGLKEAVAEGIVQILSSLSEEYDDQGINESFLIDEAEQYFKQRYISTVAEDIQGLLGQGQLKEAEHLIQTIKMPERPLSGWIDPFSKEALAAAFEEQQKSLFMMPGALGKMMNSQLTEDSLIGIMAPEKRGKTWWLMEFAMRAARCNQHVAFFEVGDMSDKQLVRRMGIYATKRSNKARYCQGSFLPVLDCMKNQTGECDKCPNRTNAFSEDARAIRDLPAQEIQERARAYASYTPCCKCAKTDPYHFEGSVWYEWRDEVDPLDWKAAYRESRKLPGIDRLHLSVHANNTMSVKGIDKELDLLEKTKGIRPKVIIVDYADLLVPDNKSPDFRHQQNEIWKGLRRLSQEQHACVITASQTDAAAHWQESVKLENFSEDKRKYAHVTAMYALNQTPKEKRKGIIRWGELLVREDDFDIQRQVAVLQCLQIGRPYISSYFVENT